MIQISEKAKLILVVEGDGLMGSAWKHRFGEQTIADVPNEEFKAFQNWFIPNFTPAEEDNDEQRFRVEVETLNELLDYMTMFQGHKQTLWLNLRKDGIKVSWSSRNITPKKKDYPTYMNNIAINIETEKFGDKQQAKIQKAIQILQGE